MLERVLTMTVATAATLALAAAPARAGDGPWEKARYDAREGSVLVDADRKRITVCDKLRDGTAVRAEYTTTRDQAWTAQAPQGGCRTRRTWLTRITGFRLCTGHLNLGRIAWDGCRHRVKTPDSRRARHHRPFGAVGARS
ncbi:hypothetical protein FE391_14040 [Nonomuraea sp. KC401]|uniref:hypothetical protein n=1 Tax=unclassified Nonomuraea TaxID=2593643 RepID=UPI0010FF1081|nr:MULTISPECIES: hypothetical protein [unclassified Nonomuraea]NBE94916.1 hypothetical protein [Nonomuraea sp. K271]TLF74686.1 hypothetical protein FE391_14040 [Nonomuraea sp. KC401]